MNNCSFKIYGSGQPVILIPGIASTANSWGFQYRWLKKYFKIITVENKGIGKLGQNDGSHSIAVVASEINEILEACCVTKTAILGSSMGAMIALEFAQRYPEKVSSLILASLPIEQTPALRHLNENINSSLQNSFDNGSFFKKILPVFFSPDFVKQDRFRIFTDLFMKNGTNFSIDVLWAQLCASREWIESKSWIEGCQCPCLFIYGSADQLVSKDDAVKQVTTVFNKSEVKIIDGAGHSAHIEKYQEFNEIVHEFLNMHNL